jgi:hypothetical protein
VRGGLSSWRGAKMTPEADETNGHRRRRKLTLLVTVWAVLAAAMILLARQNLSVPGLYYDEAVFAGMAKVRPSADRSCQQSALGCRGVRDRGNFPRGTKLLIDLVGLVLASLRIQAIAQAGKRAAVTGVPIQIGPKNFFGFGQLLRL